VAVSTDQAFSKQQLIDFAMSHGFSKTFAVRVFNHFLRAANELGLAVEYPCLHRRRPDGESCEEVHEPVIGVASHEVVLRVASGGNVSPPATGVTLPAPPSRETAERVRALSRERYGEDLAVVEAAFLARHGRRRRDSLPPVGWEEWH
jgi:phage tail protein X